MSLDAPNDLPAQSRPALNKIIIDYLSKATPLASLEGLLSSYSPETIDSNIDLIIARSLALNMRMDTLSGPGTIEPLASSIPSAKGDNAMLGNLNWGIYLYIGGQVAQASPYLEAALAQSGEERFFVYAQSVLFCAFSRSCLGNAAGAFALLEEALQEASQQNSPTQLIILAAWVGIYLTKGDLSAALTYVERMLALGHREWQKYGFYHIWRVWAHYFFALIAYLRNDLTIAETHFSWVLDHSITTNPMTHYQSIIGLAFIANARGNQAQVLEYLRLAKDLGDSTDNATMQEFTRSAMVRLTGIVPANYRLLSDFNQSTVHWLEHTKITAAFHLFNTGYLADALEVVDNAIDDNQVTNNVIHLISLYTLRALILDAQGKGLEGYGYLRQALALAEPGEIIRPFLDLGTPLLKMFKQLDPHPFLSNVSNLGAYEFAPAKAAISLTERELEVLALLDKAFPVKEIANRLSISINTTKTHIKNIYGKLGARNNRDALKIARENNLLPYDIAC